jgi:hypothetical protein
VIFRRCSRREWCRYAGGLLAAAAVAPLMAKTQRSFTANPEGGYSFLPGNPVFAGGAVAEPGHTFVHALLRRWLPLEAGFDAIERHLASVERPLRALAGIELRLPRQFTQQEFAEFNAPYVERLKRWNLLIDGFNPISRTNVVPGAAPPDEPSVHAFSYSVPQVSGIRGFVMSGMTEGTVAQGESNGDGMRRKLAQVVSTVSRRLEDLGVGWADATHIDIYSTNDFGSSLGSLLEPALGSSLRRGIRHHYGRPPVIGLELELEARGLQREIVA